MIEKAGAEILLSSRASDVIMDGHKATELFVENKSGTLAIKSKGTRVHLRVCRFPQSTCSGVRRGDVACRCSAYVYPGRQEHRPDVATGANDGSQLQAEDLRPLQVQAHRDLPSRQRAQIAAATPGDHASQLVTDQRIGSVETAAGQAIDQLRRRVRRPDECDGKMPYASRNG